MPSPLTRFSHRCPISHRRLASSAGLAFAAISLGGVPAIIALFASASILADGLLPASGSAVADSDEHFSRLVRHRRFDRWLHRLEQLNVLDVSNGCTAVARRRDLGVLAIPIESIGGTVELAKARHFDREFRPDVACAARWKPLWLACRRGDPLPPVSVYRVDGRHWLRDGHHRVSVCRHQGTTTIDAEVIELLP